MVGKKSGKALLREEGLERTDNGMRQTSWPETPMLNQKNYYTEFMKRDDQILAYRLQKEAESDEMIQNAKDRDRALARTGTAEVPYEPQEDGPSDTEEGKKTIIIHPGSQNLRIGFAGDALPKTIPMNIATHASRTESQEYEPRPKRQKLDATPEETFGEEFSKKFTKASVDLKVDMRANKRKVLPNSKELVVGYNRRTPPEKISEHNDPLRIEWTDTSKDDTKDAMTYYTGLAAQRIPEDSKPVYKLHWPIQQGWLHENDYKERGRERLFDDFECIIERAIRTDLGLNNSAEWDEYSCVFVIPDLYDKKYVEQILDMCMKNFEFRRVAFIQESLAATYGAGYTSACIVDVGAQKTSICCVEDGMCLEDSRVNLKIGGYDVTETFIKMLLHDHFPYAEINLKRRYDFLLAEELKIKHCTFNQIDVSVRGGDFHLRRHDEATEKYFFKTYDEVILAPMGFYDPSMFDNSEKLTGRRKIIDRSYNAYETDMPDDPTSSAQQAILAAIKPSLGTTANGYSNSFNGNGNGVGNGNGEISTPSKEKPNGFNNLIEMNGSSVVNSAAASPAPEDQNTPGISQPVFGSSPPPQTYGTPVPQSQPAPVQHSLSARDLAAERDSILPIYPLDSAIITSITHAAHGDDKKARDFFGGIMVIGGGAKTPGFGQFLEERLRAKMGGGHGGFAEKVLVGTSPREMDGQVVGWKGAAVFARMGTHESWVGQLEYERLGARVLAHKVLWHW